MLLLHSKLGNQSFLKMKKIKPVLILVLLFSSLFSFAQQGPALPKIKITGKVVEKISKQPLEYATVTFLAPNNPKPVAGGITNPKGEFDIEIKPIFQKIESNQTQIHTLTQTRDTLLPKLMSGEVRVEM